MNIIERIHKLARKNARIIVLPEYDDKRVLEAARIIEQESLARALVLTPDKIERVIGWKPKVDLKEGIGKTVEWIRQIDGYRI